MYVCGEEEKRLMKQRITSWLCLGIVITLLPLAAEPVNALSDYAYTVVSPGQVKWEFVSGASKYVIFRKTKDGGWT